jgi:outer membrane protein assembly factor BamB
VPVVAPASSPNAPPQVWRAKPSRRFTGTLVLAGETIYGGGLDRRVVAVDLASGQQRWASRLGGIIGGGVVVGGDTVYAATTRPEGRVSALDGKTGQRIWRTSIGPVNAPLALIGGLVIAPTQKGNIVALDARTGEVRWHQQLGVARTAAVPGDSGTFIVATVDSLFRLDAKDGRVVHGQGSPGAVVSPWIRYAGLLVAGTSDSLVVGVDPDSLTRWQVQLDAPVLNSPAASGGTVFAARRGNLPDHTVAVAIAFAVVFDAGRARGGLDWPVTAWCRS